MAKTMDENPLGELSFVELSLREKIASFLSGVLEKFTSFST